MSPTDDREFLNQLHIRLSKIEVEIDELVLNTEKETDPVHIGLVLRKLRDLEKFTEQQRAHLFNTQRDKHIKYADGRFLDESMKKGRIQMVLALIKNQQPISAYAIATSVDIPKATIYRILRKLREANLVIEQNGKYCISASMG